MSLRSRIVLAVALVFAGVSLLAGWLMLIRAETSLQTAFDRATQTRAGWLLSLVSVEPVILPLPTEAERMRVLYQTYGQTRQLFQSPGFPGSKRPTRKGPRWLRSFRSVTVQSTNEQLPDGRLILTLAVPDTTLRQDINQLRWVFGLGWLISLILAFGGGYVVAGWLLKPIQSIINQANKIDNTVSVARLALPDTQDELYQLTDTLNRMLNRIQESAELQRNFFGAAAHELRTPLTVMKTGLEVTLGGTDVNERMKPFLAGQLDEVSRLARLLDEFLTLSRPDNAPQTLKTTAVDLPDLLKNCFAKLATVAADYAVTMQIEFGAQPVKSLQTDAVKVEHIILNLLENAIKYAVSGSVVTVSLRQSESWIVELRNQTARETGPVLDLMQPYFRADLFKEGHGLGLWISHRLTTLLGGELRLSWQDYSFTSTLILPITDTH